VKPGGHDWRCRKACVSRSFEHRQGDSRDKAGDKGELCPACRIVDPPGEVMQTLASKGQLRASFVRWSLFLVPLTMLLGFVSGELGGADTPWFASLDKPAIFPPPALFGIVWSVLFAMIGFAGALVASAWGARGRALALGAFALHFVGPLAWTPVFFGLQEMRLALGILAYSVVSLAIVTWFYWRVRKWAGILLLPYLAWVGFATVLNYEFIAENPDGGSANPSGAVERFELGGE
jgi:tryptophan-rich sensory protein